TSPTLHVRIFGIEGERTLRRNDVELWITQVEDRIKCSQVRCNGRAAECVDDGDAGASAIQPFANQRLNAISGAHLPWAKADYRCAFILTLELARSIRVGGFRQARLDSDWVGFVGHRLRGGRIRAAGASTKHEHGAEGNAQHGNQRQCCDYYVAD